MSLLKSINVMGQQPYVSPQAAGEVYVNDGEVAVPTTSLALNELIGLCVLPPGCVPTDFSLVAGDLDGAAGLVLDVGVLNPAGTDLVANTRMIVGSNVGQAGGIARATALPLTFDTVERIIAAKVVTAAATPQVGNLRGILEYRGENYGR